MTTSPTPQQAHDLLSQVESAQAQAKSHDTWPIVTFLLALSASTSVGLVAVGAIADNSTQLIVLGAALSWLVPALVVYLVKARSWSRRSTFLLATWLPIVFVAYLVGILADSTMPGSWVPFAAAGVIWVASPVLALIGMRR